jgi:hypothetical protein
MLTREEKKKIDRVRAILSLLGMVVIEFIIIWLMFESLLKLYLGE